jgi:hypothetical protein
LSARGLAIGGAALLATCAGCTVTPPAPEERTARLASATIDDRLADSVFGQPDYVSGAPPTVVSAATLSGTLGIAADLHNAIDAQQLWIAESEANRARAVKAPSFEAIELHGQVTYDASAANAGGATQRSGLSTPLAVAVDATTHEWAVADTGNHRVVRGYFGGDPQLVYGQQGSWTTSVRNDLGLGLWSLAEPKGVALANSFLWVSDAGNHRVLLYWSGTTYAGTLFGQASSASGLPNRGATLPSAFSLNDPRGLAVRGTGNSVYNYTVWIADAGNHRVLEVPWGSLNPTRVLGQPGFASATPGVGPSALDTPSAVAVDAFGGVWVADTGNCRVLHFPRGSTIADRVLGQAYLTTHDCPTSPTRGAIAAPTGLAITADGDLYVADSGFHRVLRFHVGCSEDVSCDDGNPCTDDTCVADHCRHEANQAAAICAPFACNVTQGACYAFCGTANECAPGFACKYSELGSRCVRVCDTDADCAGAVGHSKCSHGVCCDRACDAPCEACDAAGIEGTCTLVIGTPRHGACPGADQDCVGSCQGAFDGSCSPALEGSACGVEGCANGVERRRGTCDGAGACLDSARACGAFGCAPSGCRTTCRSADDCAAGAYCEAGACLWGPLFSQGGGCATGRPDEGAGTPRGAALFALVVAAPVIASLARRTRSRRGLGPRRKGARR